MNETQLFERLGRSLWGEIAFETQLKMRSVQSNRADFPGFEGNVRTPLYCPATVGPEYFTCVELARRIAWRSQAPLGFLDLL